MKKVITIIIIVFTVILFITSIVKLVKNITESYVKEQSTNLEIEKKYENNYSLPKWIKQDYFLPKGSYISFPPAEELVTGKKYFLIQKISDIEKCYFGMFFLKKSYKDDLYFISEKLFSTSRLMQYSKIKSLKIMTVIYSEKDLLFIEEIQNCNEWVKIEKN